MHIFGQDSAARDAAIARIEEITAEAEVGEIYTGTVARIVDFGAFVTILPGKDGLVHISQIAEERGSHFDPRVADAFLRRTAEADAIRRALADEPEREPSARSAS